MIMTTTDDIDPLDTVLGQPRAVSFLRQVHQTKRYPNAFLFHGPPGVGKGHCALEFAKHINLTGNKDHDLRTLNLIEMGEHPDVHVFSKGDDSSFKIDIVRSAIEEAQKPMFEAERRVIILEDIQDFPSYQQSDALLKTIEDGFGDTLFILTTTALDQVFSTLRSRMTTVKFAPLPEEALKKLLVEDDDLSAFEVAIRLSEGSLTKALRFLHPPTEDSLSGHILRSRATKLLGLLDRAPVHSILKFLDSLPEDDLPLFYGIVVSLVKDLLLIEEGLDTEVINYDILRELTSICKTFDGKTSKVFEPLRILHDRQTQKGLQFSHQLKSAILMMKGGLLNA